MGRYNLKIGDLVREAGDVVEGQEHRRQYIELVQLLFNKSLKKGELMGRLRAMLGVAGIVQVAKNLQNKGLMAIRLGPEEIECVRGLLLLCHAQPKKSDERRSVEAVAQGHIRTYTKVSIKLQGRGRICPALGPPCKGTNELMAAIEGID